MRTLLHILIIILDLFCIYFIARIILVAHSFGRVAPFVPSSGKVIKKSIELLDLSDSDRLVDLGSGDGKFLDKVAKFHPKTKAVGVELSKSLSLISKVKNFIFRHKNITIINKSMFDVDYSSFNKVYCYLTTEMISSIVPKLQKELKAGTVVISAGFKFPESIGAPEELLVGDTGERLGKIYKWVVK